MRFASRASGMLARATTYATTLAESHHNARDTPDDTGEQHKKAAQNPVAEDLLPAFLTPRHGAEPEGGLVQVIWRVEGGSNKADSTSS